jgi:hypothetical protein
MRNREALVLVSILAGCASKHEPHVCVAFESLSDGMIADAYTGEAPYVAKLDDKHGKACGRAVRIACHRMRGETATTCTVMATKDGQSWTGEEPSAIAVFPVPE